MIKRYFRIGDFSFVIQSERELNIPPHFSLFETESCHPELIYDIRITDELPQIRGTVRNRRDDLITTDRDGFEERLLSIYSTYDPYALYREINSELIEIWLKASEVDETLKFDTTFTAMFALEKRMAERNSLILHSCSVTYNKNEAILFSAPSGTGKSTQGELWREYKKSRVINGDRNLLTKKDGIWYMRGWPVCGSSEICHNEEYRIRSIVMLEQAKEDEITRLLGMKAYSRILPEITFNKWDRTRMIKAMDLIETLTNDVHVYLLKCTISENAVNTLAGELNK